MSDGKKNYEATLAYLFEQLPMYHRIGSAAYRADLNNTIALCNLLGNPQKSFKSIHIAGTNGKGSVSHMLASILFEKGYKVGLYTSPHLKDFRERIRVNGRMIPKKNVTRFVTTHKEAFSRIPLSFFEWSVGLAFDHFRKEEVDIAVIEVGLGGRLDSTNIITPLLSVITNISFDHMQFLGNTLPEIAAEKAGIIKPGIPVVIGQMQPETRSVFLEKTGMISSEILFADQLFKAQMTGSSSDSLILDITRDEKTVFRHLHSPLGGHYQLKNIVTVLASCEILKRSGIELTDTMIRKGLRNVIKNTKLTGRWQVLSYSPLTICDTGHNPGGISEVIRQIMQIPHDHLHFVFGLVADKNIDEILPLLPTDATYYFCKANIPRGMDAEELRMLAKDKGLQGSSFVSVQDALTAARRKASGKDLVFIGGSTFVVAEII